MSLILELSPQLDGGGGLFYPSRWASRRLALESGLV